MPLSYRESLDQAANHEHRTTNYTQTQQHKRRRLLDENMGSRRSVSPNDGDIIIERVEGKSLNRGEIIERLKCQTWTVSQETRTLNEKSSPSPEEELAHTFANKLSPLFEDDKWARDTCAAGLDIARPRSALHSGDFRQEDNNSTSLERLNSPFESSPPETATRSLFSILKSRNDFEQHQTLKSGQQSLPNFQFLPPTSPLIHTSTNPDFEASFGKKRIPTTSRALAFSPFSVSTSQFLAGSPPSYRSSPSHAYQAHQPQRPVTIPQGPRLRPRGTSTSEVSPLQHAPMVGSYEESILRGRMSTTPSRPLDFIAQLGVLGKGRCKPGLRCPSHVTVPFPAVFYSYSSTGMPMDNSPSPYVGLIDIENNFPTYEGKAPAGGCYRIPQQGQLQIVIKNPNKTAVKLFLVPYDLSDMEPGTKTFIRQRSYSAGPVIDMPVSFRSNLGIDRPEASLSQSENHLEKPTLRYLIHLHICSPARGRYFLYRSIRVVFASRVPDGKEKLRNEVQFPEPRYTPYKQGTSIGSSPRVGPQRDSIDNSPLSISQAMFERRRSTPFSFAAAGLDQADGLFSGPTPPRATPLSTAAFQRRLCIPLQELDARVESAAPDRSDEDVSKALEQSVYKAAIGSPEVSASETVVMEPFEEWLNRRRRNAGAQ